MKDLGNSIVLRLHGNKSNRDAIGAAVMIEATTMSQTLLRQTKYLQAGSGFLSQHTKEIFFGVGRVEGTVRATIRWPRGLTQVFEHLPVNQRIEIEEGSTEFVAKPFPPPSPSYSQAGATPKLEPLPSSVETWLIDPLSAPDFSLPDLGGKMWGLKPFRGGSCFSEFLGDSFTVLHGTDAAFSSSTSRPSHPVGLRVVGINVDGISDDSRAILPLCDRSSAKKDSPSPP